MNTPQRKKLTCRNLMLNLFMDALIDNDMSVVGDDWEDILKEYNELSANNSFSATPLLMRDITYLQVRVSIIDVALDYLGKMPPLAEPEKDPFKKPRQQFVQMLKNYDYDFDFDTPETFLTDLEAVKTRAQTEALELEQRLEEWEAMQRGEQQKKPVDYVAYFDSWLEAISTKFPIKKEDIDVHSFCLRSNKAFKEIEIKKGKKAFSIHS